MPKSEKKTTDQLLSLLQQKSILFHKLQKSLKQIQEDQNKLQQNTEKTSTWAGNLKEKRKQCEVLLHSLEQKIQEKKSKKKSLCDRAGQISKAKDFKAMQSEIDQLDQSVDELETGALEAMESKDCLTKEEDEAKKSSLKAAKKQEEEMPILNHEENKKKKELQILEEDIEKITQVIPENLHDKIKKLSLKYNGDFLSASDSDAACRACQQALPRHIQGAINSPQKTAICPGCSRILIPDTFSSF